jgi:hypothetical protein
LARLFLAISFQSAPTPTLRLVIVSFCFITTKPSLFYQTAFSIIFEPAGGRAGGLRSERGCHKEPNQKTNWLKILDSFAVAVRE